MYIPAGYIPINTFFLVSLTALYVGITVKKRQNNSNLNLVLGFIVSGFKISTIIVLATLFMFLINLNVKNSPLLTVLFCLIVTLAACIDTLRCTHKNSKNKTTLRYQALSLLIIALLLWPICYHSFTWPAVKALPFSARNIREYKWQEPFIPDYDYYMRANITEDQFKAYLQNWTDLKHSKRNLENYRVKDLRQDHLHSEVTDLQWWKPRDSEVKFYSNKWDGGGVEIFYLDDQVYFHSYNY